MVSPLKSVAGGVEKAAGNFVQPLVSTLNRAVVNPVSSFLSGPGIPAPPDMPAPATQPTAKPGKKGIQSSFLSGVAGQGLSGQSGGGGTGKSLLGQ